MILTEALGYDYMQVDFANLFNWTFIQLSLFYLLWEYMGNKN